MTDHDVLVVGGGPAGASAALFTARYGLDTVVLDRGSSSLQQCAFLENYLGFPGGIDIERFAAMAHAHVERVGGTVAEEMVTAVECTDGSFRIETQAGHERTADALIAASTYDDAYLLDLHEAFATERDGETVFDRDHPGEEGRTAVDGLYVAGPLAGAKSQAIISAGHGAQVGLAVVTDHRQEARGLWDSAAEYHDWVVEQGRYEGEEWVQQVADYHIEHAPADRDDETVRRKAREVAERRRDSQIATAEIERRTQRAHERLLDFVPDDAILARAETLAARSEAE